MKNFIFFLLSAVFVISCSTSKNDSSVEPDNLSSLQIKVDQIQNLQNSESVLNSQLEKFTIGKSLNNKTSHTYSKDLELNKEFINVFGYDSDGNSVAYRQEVTSVIKDDGSIILNFVENGIGETCTGVNCSHCEIKEGGGCDCKQAGDPDPSKATYCNHKVSTDPPKEGIY